MFKHIRTLLCLLCVITLLEPITARKSYPSSRGGLSGAGHSSHSYPSRGSHAYPPSRGGLSGTGSRPQSHGYPSSGGLSGSGGSHSYPSSNPGSLSGSGSRPYPSSSGNQPHTYPSSSGNQPHTYPSSSGVKPHTYPSSSGVTHTNTVQHHYHYSPPQQIRYVSPSGGAMSYPVYRGQPPTYVYKYQDSGSKYGTLLAGLALLNLGTLAGGIYAASHNRPSSHYEPKPGEVCKFGLRKDNGDYEETKIDCQIISSFIMQEQGTTHNNTSSNNTSVTTTTVTNVTTMNTYPVQGVPVGNDVMLPNGTLVPANVTNPAINSTTTTVTVTTTTSNTTDALSVKGKPVEVTPGMKCYVIRSTPTSNMRKAVECGLLQTYATQSLRKNSAVRNIPTFTILTTMIAAFIFY